MHIEAFRDYCLSLPAVTESFPFGGDTLVFKVANKLFALTNIELFERVNVKCDPLLAVELREQYSFVKPGFHMNKKHWNTIVLGDHLSDQLLQDWIRHSYDIVVAGLPKKIQAHLNEI